MPRIRYVPKKFSDDHREILDAAVDIIREYAADGYAMTMRQLYYQFVARALVPNTQQSYKRIGSIINDGRLAGVIDWNAIEDRTRSLAGLSHWSGPEEIIREDAECFRVDKWSDQPARIEVWIEKEALAGVFERVCQRYDVPFLSCRGYTSQSEMWRASQRLKAHKAKGQHVVILHFGDHDPSGIDMSRDIVDRLAVFGVRVDFDRLALNFDQVEEYKPPPNPTKITDSRAAAYIQRFGGSSWELDALDPKTLSKLVENAIFDYRDVDLWEERIEEEQQGRAQLENAAENWSGVVDFLEGAEG